MEQSDRNPTSGDETDMTDDMKTKTLDELVQIVAEGEAKKEQLEREFRVHVLRSLMRIEDELKIARYGIPRPPLPQEKLKSW